MPLSVLLCLGLVTLFGVIPVTLKIAGYLLGRRRMLCPGCDRKALALTGAAVAARQISESAQDTRTWAEYECEHCHEKFVKPLGTGMMSRTAWIEGAKEPIPTAIIVERNKP